MHYLGRLLNQAQRQSDALDRLEAAILIEPERWAAQLDYALVLGATGDHLSAANLLDDLSKNPAVESGVRDNARRLLNRQPTLPSPSRSTILGLSTGHDDNLLGVTRYDTVELTLPGGVVVVDISQTQRQISGNFLKLEVNHEADLHIDENALWRYSLFGTQRWSIDYRPADQSNLGFQLERSPTQAFGMYSIGVLQQFNLGGEAALRQWQLGTGVEWNGKFAGITCRARFGGEILNSFFPGNHIYDGRYAGLVSHWICPEQQMQVQLRAGNNDPIDNDRPGGDLRQYALYAARHFPIGSGNLSAEFNYFQLKDRTGYSPLLENNAPRRLTSSIYRLEYRWDMGKLSPYVGVEWLDQKANLPLFSPSNRILTIGLRQML